MLEICVDSIESGIEAAKGGADRIELCGNLVIGGTTPELSLFQILKSKIDIPINVMIRPRYGDFFYSEHEFEVMQKTLRQFRKNGADGFVFGILTPDGDIDKERLGILMADIGERRTTLHRCFDMCRDMEAALFDAIDIGFDTILTSGGKDSCVEGVEILNSLHELADGHIDIMAGAGVSADNIRILRDKTGITSFHMSGKTIVDSDMRYRKNDVSMGIRAMSEYEIIRTDADLVSKVKMALS